MALVLDTGVLYATLDEADPDHERCTSLIEETPERLVIPAPVLVEVDYWVRKYATADAWLAFCEDIQAGAYALYHLDAAGLTASAQLQAQYSDLPLGLVDASVFVTCETLGEPKVATLDRRHFSILRTREGRTLQILPD